MTQVISPHLLLWSARRGEEAAWPVRKSTAADLTGREGASSCVKPNREGGGLCQIHRTTSLGAGKAKSRFFNDELQ